jgi:hypothetical protein
MSKVKSGPEILRTQKRAAPSKRRHFPTAHDTGAGIGLQHKTEDTRPTEVTPICRVIHSEASYISEQGLSCFIGVSAETVGYTQGVATKDKAKQDKAVAGLVQYTQALGPS